MNTNEAISFCKLWLPAWTGNQPTVLLDFYADKIFYCDPAKPNGINGKESLTRYFNRLLSHFPYWVWELVEVFPQQNGFILKWVACIRPDQNKFFGIDIVEIDNDLITRNEIFFDPSHLLQS